jgi:hypothetical protein
LADVQITGVAGGKAGRINLQIPPASFSPCQLAPFLPQLILQTFLDSSVFQFNLVQTHFQSQFSSFTSTCTFKMGKDEGFAPGKHTLLFPLLAISSFRSRWDQPSFTATAASPRMFASEDVQ